MKNESHTIVKDKKTGKMIALRTMKLFNPRLHALIPGISVVNERTALPKDIVTVAYHKPCGQKLTECTCRKKIFEESGPAEQVIPEPIPSVETSVEAESTTPVAEEVPPLPEGMQVNTNEPEQIPAPQVNAQGQNVEKLTEMRARYEELNAKGWTSLKGPERAEMKGLKTLLGL